LEKVGFNLLLSSRLSNIKKKLICFTDVLHTLEDLRSETSFGLLKVQPIVTYIENDIDILVPRKNDLRKILSVLRARKHLKVFAKGFMKGITLYDIESHLKIDLYERIGWRGLYAVELESLNNHTVLEEILVSEDLFKVPVIEAHLDLLTLVIHLYESSGFIRLSDVLKLLLLMKQVGGDVVDVHTYFNVKRLLSFLTQQLVDSSIREFLIKGEVKLLPSHLFISHVEILLNNLIKRGAKLPSLLSYYCQLGLTVKEILALLKT